jgi:hypothetical protein
MTNPKFAHPAAPRCDENLTARSEGQRELSHRGLLTLDRDRDGEPLPDTGGFVREVQLPRRARRQRSSWPTDRMA